MRQTGEILPQLLQLASVNSIGWGFEDGRVGYMRRVQLSILHMYTLCFDIIAMFYGRVATSIGKHA